MNIKIEHGIPITKCSASGIYVHELRKMKPGDSFIVDGSKRSNAMLAAARIGISVVSRKVDKNTVRIWRVK